MYDQKLVVMKKMKIINNDQTIRWLIEKRYLCGNNMHNGKYGLLPLHCNIIQYYTLKAGPLGRLVKPANLVRIPVGTLWYTQFAKHFM